MEGPRCSVCSHPLRGNRACGNPICGWSDRAIGRVYAISEKTGAIDRVVRNFKYADRPTAWATILGRLVFGWLGANLANDDYDLIVVNPTHESRAVRHTELILAAAAREDQLSEWPFAPHALEKTSETSKSASGNWHAKWKAAQELYGAVRPAAGITFSGARVLLMDDVTTTLAQLHVVGTILKRAGATAVDGLVIARQVRR